MLNKNYKLERLLSGQTFTTSEKGSSMVPLVYSGQEHTLTPATIKDVVVGDIVYCKVHGRMYTHLVKALNGDQGALIGNNRGFNNGWTSQIYGKVIAVGDKPYKP
jgi:hypothetical protein